MPLHFEWTGLELENSRQARLTLPKPRLNQFELLAHYTLPQTGKNLHGLDIPLVRASDAKDVSGRLEFAADYPAELTVDDPQWVNRPGAGRPGGVDDEKRRRNAFPSPGRPARKSTSNT